MNKKIDFDDYTKEYEDLLQTQHKRFGNVSYYSKYKIDILKSISHLSKPINILEFGCGIGRNLPFLESGFMDSTIYGFDISKKSIKKAKQDNPNIKFIKSDDFKNYDNFFDLIFIAGVYHHIPVEQRNFVSQQIYKLCKSNAKIVIFEHNPYNPLTMKMVNTCEFDKDAVVLKKNELIKLFLDNNYSYINSSYTLFLPPKLKILNFIEKYLFWCPLGGQYYIVVKKC